MTVIDLDSRRHEPSARHTLRPMPPQTDPDKAMGEWLIAVIGFLLTIIMVCAALAVRLVFPTVAALLWAGALGSTTLSLVCLLAPRLPRGGPFQ